MRKWTSEEIRILNSMYGTVPAKIIAKELNRSIDSVYGAVRRIRPEGMQKPYPLRKMSRTTRLYIAGMFDADGTVGLYLDRKRGRYAPQLSISTSYTEYAEWLAITTGLNKARRNKINNGRGYFFQVGTAGKEKIRAFLIQIQDHLVLKKDQVEVMVDWIDGKMGDKTASDLLKSLKRKP